MRHALSNVSLDTFDSHHRTASSNRASAPVVEGFCQQLDNDEYVACYISDAAIYH